MIGQMARLLSGRIGVGAAALLVVCYLCLAFAPFRWSPPRRIQNGAYRTETGTLAIPSEGFVRVGDTATPWLDGAMRTGRVRVRLRVRSFCSGGTIFSYADWGGGDRNLLIEQQGEDLVVIFRIRDVPARDHRTHVVPAVFGTTGWHNVELILEEGAARLCVDGRKVVANRLPEQALSDWKTGPNFGVTLANVLSGAGPWLGEMAACVVQTGDVRVDYLDPETTEIASHFWVNMKFNLEPDLRLTRDNVANFVCFIPLGFVVASLRGRRGSFLTAALFCSGLSGCVELTQFGFVDHMPSFTDWLTNSAGGAVGALAARGCLVDPRSASPAAPFRKDSGRPAQSPSRSATP